MQYFTPESLFDAARGQLDARLASGTPGGESVPDYKSIAADFVVNAELDRSGLGQKLAEIESDSGVLPHNPPTLRGRFGRLAFGLSSRLLWWIPRAFRLRDSALRGMYEALLSSREEQDRELRLLRARVDALERALEDA